MSRFVLGLMASVLAQACVDSDRAPAAQGPSVAVTLAALQLDGVGDVVWDIEVVNGATPATVVFSKRVASSQFGDGAGSAAFVGPCDASPGAALNTVRVWVVDVFAAPVTTLGQFAAGAPGGVAGAAIPFSNPTATAPLAREVTCQDDGDTLVRFDVAIARPASQGFFDLAVSFNDVFCSAKFDCCEDDDDDGTCERDLDLLFDAGGARDATMVLAFACTAGAGGSAATDLYLDALVLDCTDPSGAFAADLVIDPSRGPGNVCTAGQIGGGDCAAVTSPNGTDADTFLYQVATYRGTEALTSNGLSANKVYWNVALGVKPAIAQCCLRTRATADDALDASVVSNGSVPAGVAYPYVSWDLALDGTCSSEPLGQSTKVTTAYTTIGGSGTGFAYGFGPSRPAGGFCAAPCMNGGVCASGACACAEHWGGATCTTPLDACAGNPCGVGTCVVAGDDYTCSCPLGSPDDGTTCVVQPATCGMSGACPDGFACVDDNCVDVAMDEVYIPAGQFWMGCNTAVDTQCQSDWEVAQHLVTLSPYTIDRTEATAAQYAACATRSQLPRCQVPATFVSDFPTYGTYGKAGFAQHPVNYVNWQDAKFYCEDQGKRLCTEAEWERAARGGCETLPEGVDCRSNMRLWPWGDAAPSCSLAQMEGCNGHTAAVGSKPLGASPYGVLDMAGNLWEWTADKFEQGYSADPVTDPQGPADWTDPNEEDRYVIRGSHFDADARLLRSSQRGRLMWQNSVSFGGIRCCRSMPATP